MRFTGIFTWSSDGWWVAQCAEVPGANTQGKTLRSAQNNLKDAIRFMLKVEGEERLKKLKPGKKAVIRKVNA